MAEVEVTHPLDVFPELVWKKIFVHVSSPKDIQNVCTASAYFDLLMTENGRKGEAQFGMIYPIIRPYLGPELELLARKFTIPVPNIFPEVVLQNTWAFKQDIEVGLLGKIRQVCPYWRKIVWNDALQKLNKKYTILPYTPDMLRTRSIHLFLILTPRTKQQPWAYQSIEDTWQLAYNWRMKFPQMFRE